MNKKWMVSLTATVFIYVAGIYSYFYIKDEVPKQLKASTSIIITESQEQKEIPLEIKDIIHDAQRLVVMVELPDGSIGSGFLYNNQGDVVTNAHVAANAQQVTIKTADSRELEGQVIGISNEIDVAVIRVSGLAGTEPLKIAKNRSAYIGDEVLALGSPLGLQNTVTTGIISGIDRDFDIDPFHYEDVYQISAPIAPGNSGGPLIDKKTGEVLGINSAGMNQGDIGFTIPITSVANLIDGWIAKPMTTIPSINFSKEQYSSDKAFSIEELSVYMVTSLYDYLNDKDYVTAYALLGSSWQSSLSYEKFRNGYLHTAEVTIDDISVTSSSNEATVTAIITALETSNGTSNYSKYSVSYKVGYENDKLKLLSGKGKEIK